eukprot:TRINITY_DN1238_c0_g2_i2.p1 TRINITY_DN1238_c0_g2~~TRINITY_DN1238_c0_g2_i2.p1  ORF type:complete len:111 (+),score=31.89 TRINITY_DN1238_c0_g2_i2:31-333(+)
MSKPSTTHGTKNELIGAVKEKTGKLIGNPNMVAEGIAQNEVGKEEKYIAKELKHEHQAVAAVDGHHHVVAEPAYPAVVDPAHHTAAVSSHTTTTTYAHVP